MTGRGRPAGPRGGDRRAGRRLAGLARLADARRLKAGEAGLLWGRLTAVDFFGNSFELAALAILCFFPFLIVVTAAFGRDAATVLAGWLGLDEPAARAVAALFHSGTGSVTITVTSACLLLLGALAVAGTLQRWYEKVFDVPDRGWRGVGARFSWLGALLAYAAVQAAAGRALGTTGGPLLQALLGLLPATLFWWCSLRLLLGAVPWRELFPAALATGVCWAGLGLFSARYFSAEIVANQRAYGPIGVVMIIMSWLVAVGVVIHLGAVGGRAYVERRSPPPSTGGPHRPDLRSPG
ncbi:hypothetical protein GCM10023085_44400 [Actinomadura viridis]|uniref:Membrane protein n=1 Tax=Actinomadura viridis TaxID=58110 RepID=A0A931DKL8_9ACTN|nr:YhjD/YihY/BrkB family envelope integrity protein [Actinomadura viridis]MBG6089802.1 membrane protein [Actinomadura viridis]